MCMYSQTCWPPPPPLPYLPGTQDPLVDLPILQLDENLQGLPGWWDSLQEVHSPTSTNVDDAKLQLAQRLGQGGGVLVRPAVGCTNQLTDGSPMVRYDSWVSNGVV